MYQPELRAEVSQGDIFADVAVPEVTVNISTNESFVNIQYTQAILLTHDCEYDKPACDWIMIATVRKLSDLDEGTAGHIRANRVKRAFYLPPSEQIPEETFVDFRRIDRVSKNFMFQFGPRRILSLTEDARLALQRQLAAFFGYNLPEVKKD
jgi:hypothetical protein